VTERITLDANVLVYALDERNPTKQNAAFELIGYATWNSTRLVTVTLGEFFWTVSRKGLIPGPVAKERVQNFATLFPIETYTVEHLIRAADAVISKQFSFWDAVMLSCAEEAGCTVCFSEDMADGARLGNITVRNPFGPKGLSDVAKAVLGIA
jgi:predicted nucleic acid-binding protein